MAAPAHQIPPLPADRDNQLRMVLCTLFNIDGVTLGVYDTHPVIVTLGINGIATTTDFLAFSTTDFQNLPTVPPHINSRTIKILTRLRTWASDKYLTAQWQGLTLESLIAETDVMYRSKVVANMETFAAAQAAAGVANAATVRTPAESYKNRVKIDTKTYPEYKTDGKFGAFMLSVQSIARNQGISNVFDPEFDPSTLMGDELAEFRANEATAMEVLVNCIKYQPARAIVRRHAKDCTAHACFREMYIAFMTGPTGASGNSAETCKCPTTTKILVLPIFLRGSARVPGTVMLARKLSLK